jgi:kynurenine formamidase
MNPRPRIVDLTLPVETGMAGIPRLAFYDKYPVVVQAVTVINEDQRKFLQGEGTHLAADAEATGTMNTVFTMNSHIGTHIDAPRHFYPEGDPIDRHPLDQTVMREAVVFDLSGKEAGAGVTGDDLERTGVKPGPGEIAVIKTRWTDRAWGTPDFWGQMIYLEPSVGEWTLRHGVAAVAMDCFPEKAFWRVPVTPAERGANHKMWLKAGVPMIQMLTRLDQLGPRFTMIALPLGLKGMDGSPARVIGIEGAFAPVAAAGRGGRR